MQKNNDELSGFDSFKIIESMITSARNQMTENGHLYLLWGWVIFICSIGQFLMQHVFHTQKFWMIWLLTWPTVIYQFIFIAKKVKKIRVKNYTDDILKYIWLVFIVCMIISAVIISKISDKPEIANMLILMLYGMPTFLSGIVLKFKPLVIGGTCCWLLSLVSIFVLPQYHMLLIAAAVIAAWIIPGYMLKSKYNKSNTIA